MNLTALEQWERGVKPQRVTDFSISQLEILESDYRGLPAEVRKLIEFCKSGEERLPNGKTAFRMASHRIQEILDCCQKHGVNLK